MSALTMDLKLGRLPRGLRADTVNMENLATVHLLDTDAQRSMAVEDVARRLGYEFEWLSDTSQLAQRTASDRPGCLIVSDVALTRYASSLGRPVTDFQDFSSGGRLNLVGRGLTTLVICEQPDVASIVRFMRAGAMNVLPMPLEVTSLSHWIEEAVTADRMRIGQERSLEKIRKSYNALSERKRCVLQHMIDGRASKWSAHVLDVSRRTIELDRAEILNVFSVNNAIELARLMTETKCLPLDFTHMPSSESLPLSLAK